MNKRYLILGIAVLALVAMAIPAAFAADADNPAKAWFDQILSAKKVYVDQAVESGRLTEAQGNAIKSHWEQMYEWREQNNFTCPLGNPGMGMGFGRGGGWHGGMGYGPGFGYNQPATPAQ